MVKVKIRCRKCGWEGIVDINPSPTPLSPGDKAKGIKIKYSKDDIEKILEASDRHGGIDLGQIGIEITNEEFLEAAERLRIKKFLEENLSVTRIRRPGFAEDIKQGTDLWTMGDKFSNINISSSEIASMGVEDMRMIPGITLKKNTYMKTRGKDRDILRGVKFINFLDVSGSMFDGSDNKKIGKALVIAEEIYKFCKQLGFEYHLGIFSGTGQIIPSDKISSFFRDSAYRSTYSMGGGTNLSSILDEYTDEEYQDTNLLVISDLALGDTGASIERLKHIASFTNSFKAIVVEYGAQVPSEDEIKKIFPEGNVSILAVPV